MKKALTVLGALLMALVLFSCGGKGSNLSFTPGTYQGTGSGRNGDIVVEVTVSSDSIKKIEVVEESETPAIAGTAMKEIPGRIIEQQSLSVDSITGATLASDGIIAAVKDALSKSGVDMDALMVAAEKTESGEVKQLSADVVIIGTGAAGTAAALEATEEGASVIVLEKAPVPGGASKLAGGIFALNSAEMKNAGYTPDFSIQDVLRTWQEYNAYLSDGNLFYSVFENSGDTADWLEANGFDFTYVGFEQAAHSEGYPVYHAYADQAKKLEYFQNALKIVEERGGEIYYDTTATKLNKEGEKICGVEAKQGDGTILQIKSRAVILATGGAGANKELVREFNGFDLMNITTGTQTGDAITMTRAIGAGEGNAISELHGVTVPGYVPNVPEREPLTYLAYFPASVFINHNGFRFVEEDIVFDTALTSNAAYAQGESYYAVMSANVIKDLEQNGPVKTYGDIPDVNYQVGIPLYPVSEPWTGLTASLEKGTAEGTVVKGETLEELAGKIDVDPSVLKKTFDQYNGFAREGVDPMYGKEARYMIEQTEGPFYAVLTIPVSLGQIGGIAVDSSLHVLSEKGTIIPGLYVSGNDVAELYNNTYPTVEGITLGFAFGSGRMAARLALSE